MTGLEREVLAIIAERGPISKRKATVILRRRKQDVARAVSALERSGTVHLSPDGYAVVPCAREAVPTRPPRRRRDGLSVYFGTVEVAEAVLAVLEQAERDDLGPAVAAVEKAIDRRHRRDAEAGS